MTDPPRPRRPRRWLVGVLLAFVLVGLPAVMFFYAGHLLVQEREPRPADIGVILAGKFTRAMYAADLYHQGLIPAIWITRPEREQGLAQLDELGVPYPRQEEISRQVLLKKGVPADRIGFIGEGLVNTIAEARLVSRMLGAAPQYRSVLVITSKFHVRRAEAIFRHVLASSPGVAVVVVGTPYDRFVADRWWTDRDSARQIFFETAKLALFWVKLEY
jgi:uncharacterized SAM-binding protein YcdF (DUF218 family)